MMNKKQAVRISSIHAHCMQIYKKHVESGTKGFFSDVLPVCTFDSVNDERLFAHSFQSAYAFAFEKIAMDAGNLTKISEIKNGGTVYCGSHDDFDSEITHTLRLLNHLYTASNDASFLGLIKETEQLAQPAPVALLSERPLSTPLYAAHALSGLLAAGSDGSVEADANIAFQLAREMVRNEAEIISPDHIERRLQKLVERTGEKFEPEFLETEDLLRVLPCCDLWKKSIESFLKDESISALISKFDMQLFSARYHRNRLEQALAYHVLAWVEEHGTFPKEKAE